MGDTGSRTRKKRKVKHRFFVPPSRFTYPESGEPIVELDADTTHHLRNVLRLNTGAFVTLFDNSGQEYEGGSSSASRPAPGSRSSGRSPRPRNRRSGSPC